MLRFVPPAGAPLGILQIAKAMGRSLLGDRRHKPCLTDASRWLGTRHSLGVNSGRTALWLILKALHKLKPDRDTVVLPGYTCFTVPASVVRAGLKMRALDVDLQTLDFDASQLALLSQIRPLCIVTSSLFGFSNDISLLRRVARENDIFVVDDAAQALGASCNGELAGTRGDVGLFSFGRGKAAAAVEGGLITTESDVIFDAIQREALQLPVDSLLHSGKLLLQMAAYSVFLKPRLYWIPNSLPFLKLGTTEFDPDFPTGDMPCLSRALLPGLLSHLDVVNDIRAKNASGLAAAILDVDGLAIPKPTLGSRPTFVRFPVIAGSQVVRDRIVSTLQSAGIGASSFYPAAICDLPELGPFADARQVHCPNAESLASTLFTLPTHPYVQERDIARMQRIIRKVVYN